MLRKTRIITIMCLIIASAVLVAACNKPTGTTSSTLSGGSDLSASVSSQGEPTKLTVAFLSWVPEPPDFQMVQDELNKLLKEKINVEVEFMAINGGDYQQQINLMLTGSDKLDLLVTGTALGYYVQAATGQLRSIDDLLESEGEDLLAEVDQRYIDACRGPDGKIYGVPSMRSFTGQTGFMMRKDLVDKYHIDVDSIKTLDDLDTIFKIIKDNEPDIAPIIPEAPGAGIYGNRVHIPYDPLGNTLGVLPNYAQELKVYDLFQTEEYSEWVYKLREWNQKGYIIKDAATNQETAADLLKADRGFGHFIGITLGSEVQATLAYGMEMVAAGLGQPFGNNSYITQIIWSIPTQSQYPEKAMELMNLLFSDAEVINLIDYGIEDVHYVKVSDNVIKFPDNINPAEHPYNFNLAWEFGNQFLSYVMEGNPSDHWDQVRSLNDSAMYSKALGFIPNVDSLQTEIATTMGVFAQYDQMLNTGSVDPDVYLPEFIAKLKEAGIDTIVDEKQRQLNEWLDSLD